MSETPLMNDEAARSATGEIIDQATPPTPPTPPTDGTPPTPPTPEAKPPTDGEKPSEPKSPVDPKAVPETYEFKAPEGYTIDPKLLETVAPIFKELGLTNEQAQKLVDIQVAREIATAKGPSDDYTATRTQWQNEVKADKDMVGYGLDNVKADIGKVISALPAELQPDFRKAMDITGAGDHPAFVKAMWKLASLVTEGSHVTGKGPSSEGQRAPGTAAKPSPAAALYPKLA